MTLILKSDNTKNGIILKEIAKKFEEATSTSGCDLEMSEITSSMPHSLQLTSIESCAELITKTYIKTSVDLLKEDINIVNVREEILSEVEDVIDGFSVFAFVTEDELIKFSIDTEKIQTIKEEENYKCKKITKTKKEGKITKAIKEQLFNEDGIDIYDFPANSESSPSSKDSGLNFKNTLSKKYPTKYAKKYKHKFKTEGMATSPSEDNSSSTSVTDCHHHTRMPIDGHNDSPRPTSNEDNNVVSTTTPDNGNIARDGTDQLSSVPHPMKTASLRLYKLEDELSSTSNNVARENRTELTNEQPVSTFYSDSDYVKVHNIQQNQCNSGDEKYQSNAVPAKFSVDLITKITDNQLETDECNHWTETSKSVDRDSNISQRNSSNDCQKHAVFGTGVATADSNKMQTVAMTNAIGDNCCSTSSAVSFVCNSNGSCNDGRAAAALSRENKSTNNDDDDIRNDKNTVDSPMQSWLELHNKGLIHQQQLQQQQRKQHQHNNGQTISNPTILPTKSGNASSYNTLNHSTHLDWKSKYYDSSILLANSVPKYNQSLSSLSQELINNMRYQHEQQDLMNALRSKHENSRIPKPMVTTGLDAMYNVDHIFYKNPESKFQTPNVHNYSMSNPQIATEFNTANSFKTRSDARCHPASTGVTANKESFTKILPTLSSSNFKGSESLKRRGLWCDMHVKIAYFIYRSQKRMSLIKSQEVNSQFSHLLYNQKLPPTTSVPTASAYPANFLQHSNTYFDYRSSQIKPDPGYLNYNHPKSSSAFLNPAARLMNPYHSIISPVIDVDLPQTGNNYDDHHHHQSAEDKWLRLLNQYMASHPMTSFDRPNPEVLNQLYLWYHQLTQSNNHHISHFNSQTAPNLESQNSAYLRKYMEHLSACLGAMKTDAPGYGMNNSMGEFDMHLFLMKQQQQQQQQQYQKALLSKYQSASANKAMNINHTNPLLLKPPGSLYTKKLVDMKPVGIDGLFPPFVDGVQTYRQYKHDSSANHHHTSRNGFVKLPDVNSSKRRKLNPELMKTDVTSVGGDKDDSKSVMDLTGDFVNITTVNNGTNNKTIGIDKDSATSRDF